MPLRLLIQLAEAIVSVRSSYRLIGWTVAALVALVLALTVTPLQTVPKVVAVFVLIGLLAAYIAWSAWYISRQPSWASEEVMAAMVEARYQFEVDGRALPPAAPRSLPPAEKEATDEEEPPTE